ncbi:MAG TPA: hypothetical protein VFN26_11390 [Candidatus Acidoferrum sp.]|nr:hypothetical protein [Candidatus Acidoferrum sp.]
MADQELNYLRPLCPTHYKVMLISPSLVKDAALQTSTDVDIHHSECPVDGCPQNYSPGFGYFTIARNEDHWVGTGSSSLRIVRSHTQAICGAHKDAMFIESFDAEAKLDNFRCPRKNCRHALKILAGGPPAYWLTEGFFGGGD